MNVPPVECPLSLSQQTLRSGKARRGRRAGFWKMVPVAVHCTVDPASNSPAPSEVHSGPWYCREPALHSWSVVRKLHSYLEPFNGGSYVTSCSDGLSLWPLEPYRNRHRKITLRGKTCPRNSLACHRRLTIFVKMVPLVQSSMPVYNCTCVQAALASRRTCPTSPHGYWSREATLWVGLSRADILPCSPCVFDWLSLVS